jgi:hypothetical protein
MPTWLARLVCLAKGHQPTRCHTDGHVDTVAEVPAGPRTALMRTVAEIDWCTRCGARRLALDPQPLGQHTRWLIRWVSP